MSDILCQIEWVEDGDLHLDEFTLAAFPARKGSVVTKSARSDVLKQFIIFFVFYFYPVSRRLSHRFVTLLT